jgi:hypothetical protein
MGVQELVRFDADDSVTPLRIWDRAEFALVERDLTLSDFMRCRTLDAYFCVREDEKLGSMLRLARDAEGRDLFPTPAEARRAAEARIRELEAELARRARDESR